MILAIDTAGPVIGAACGDRRFSQRIVRGADSVLTPALARLVEGVTLRAVAVTVGPGAFTGLRVGVSAALGLAFARRLPVIPVSALHARASMATHSRVLSLLDGRKGRAYAAFYVDGERVGDEADLPPDQAIALAQGDFVAVGEGALVWEDLVRRASGRILDGAGESPAVAMLALAGRLPSCAPEKIRLQYIRAADARKPTLS